MFEDRHEAGRRLSKSLAPHIRRPGGIVLAVPKGGVPVGRALAWELGLPFDVLITSKLRCPSDPALAVGAAAETGTVFLNPAVPGPERLRPGQLHAELRRVHEEIMRGRRLYRGGRGLPCVRGRPTILVDDGAVTGATMIAAAKALRRLGASPLIIAVPAAPLAVAAALSSHADELAVVEAPEEFESLARHYRRWEPVREEDVLEALAELA